MTVEVEKTMIPVSDQKTGFIALLGAPNAGKSSLLNKLVKQKLAIVTRKPQTTRKIMDGIIIHKNAQLVFFDLPGIFKTKSKFDRQMVTRAWGRAEATDCICLIIDGKKGFDPEVMDIIDALKNKDIKPILVINKVDLMRKEDIADITEEAEEMGIFEKIFFLSALNGQNVEDYKDYLQAKAPKSPWVYPEDDITTSPMREIAAEITREQLYLRMGQELPYSIHVETDKWDDTPTGRIQIYQTIYVLKESQKPIIIGKKGEMLKNIGMYSRKTLEYLLERPVDLLLYVKVDPKWQEEKDFQ